ncbi:MAG: SH3 domain-containing protein [Bdellovibrionaceae bacterium]|nr:SH3 domain-containing protein [Pseudobdellovibrionaceae bacterium]
MANSMVLVLSWIVSVFVFLYSPVSSAQNIGVQIIGEFPYVYAAPDFDAPVIANLKPGSDVQVSKQQFGIGFHRILVGAGKIGYISSSEVRLLNAPIPVAANKKKNSGSFDNQDTIDEKKSKKKESTKNIVFSRFQGLIYEAQNYVEDTMAKTRGANLGFIGYRVVGMNTIFSGEMSTDFTIMMHSGAPKYYEDITRVSATGGVLNTHFTFDTIVPVSHNFMASYGFGPMMRYSHYEVSMKSAAGFGNQSYVLDDMTLGVLFRLGVGLRIGIISFRSDIKYYIESKQYASMNLSTLFEF